MGRAGSSGREGHMRFRRSLGVRRRLQRSKSGRRRGRRWEARRRRWKGIWRADLPGRTGGTVSFVVLRHIQDLHISRDLQRPRHASGYLGGGSPAAGILHIDAFSRRSTAGIFGGKCSRIGEQNSHLIMSDRSDTFLPDLLHLPSPPSTPNQTTPPSPTHSPALLLPLPHPRSDTPTVICPIPPAVSRTVTK